MKKVSLIITALALTAGLSTAVAGKLTHRGNVQQANLLYTQNGKVVFTGTRGAAEDNLGCHGSVAPICAKAYTDDGNKTRLSGDDIFFND